jgi:hypothetical protein
MKVRDAGWRDCVDQSEPSDNHVSRSGPTEPTSDEGWSDPVTPSKPSKDGTFRVKVHLDQFAYCGSHYEP